MSFTFLAGLSAAVPAQDGFPANEDLRHVRNLYDPRISPDGTQVLLHLAEATADGGLTHVYVIDVAHNRYRQITYSPAGNKSGERHARWLGAGAVVFLAKRGEHTQIFKLPMDGGEARAFDLSIAPPVDESQAADAIPPRKPNDPPAGKEPVALDVEDFEVAPGGHLIAVVARDPETPGEKKQKEAKADAHWVDHEQHGKRLYLLDSDSGKLTSVAVAPEVAQVIFAPQGDRLMVLCEPPHNLNDLGPKNTAWLVMLSDPGHAEAVKELPATVEDGLWSEDAAQFYFLAQSSADAPPGYGEVFALNLKERSIRTLSGDFSGTVTGARPLTLGKDVLQAAQFGTRRGYLRMHDKSVEPVSFATPVATAMSCTRSGSACTWLGQGAAQPNALFFARDLRGKATLLATPALSSWHWNVSSQLIRWQNEGLALEGLLYLPPQAGGRVPLVVDVHGGPTGAWSDGFEPLVAFCLAQGWAVFRPNPRGSTGYGAHFAAANKNDLGGGDFRDIMTGTDAVLARFPIDTERLALIGYSYGGEMAGFVEGQTNRFKAIVSAAPVIDQHSEYGTELSSWYDRWFYGKPWENAEAAWRQSPLAHVANAKTPFLLIQGDEDVTDPPGQSQEMYRALRQVGVHVELVLYPREGHPPLSAGMRGFPVQEPWHGFDVRQRIVRFINAGFGQGF